MVNSCIWGANHYRLSENAFMRSDKKRMPVSPTSQTTNENGQATFTISAKKKAGKAKVTFQAAGQKKSITVTVKK